MPEELNRRLTDHLATLLLTTSQDANENLAAEGIVDGVRLVVNTMIDSLEAARPAASRLGEWEAFGLERGKYVLVTLHRPALVDDPVMLKQTIAALGLLAETLPVIFPVHPRTRERIASFAITIAKGVILTPHFATRRFSRSNSAPPQRSPIREASRRRRRPSASAVLRFARTPNDR